MIKVGFIGTITKEWMGGLNYFKNLLAALDTIENKELDIYVYVGKKTDIEIKKMFKKYATVIECSLFDRKSIKWFLMKIEEKIFRTNFLLEKTFQKNNLDILSHSSITNFRNLKTINWIPDFQHIHLPKMFTKSEVNQRNKKFLEIIEQSDSIVVSSHNALKDLKEFAPGFDKKSKVLQFVSQPDESYYRMNKKNLDELRQKYSIESDFFYIPNQIWKHKNHMLVFEAVKLLKRQNIEISIICSGHQTDYRNENHIEDIKSFIERNNLNKNIKLLGLIDYSDVFGLMKISKAVINPSLFEGWSSTVEECKSLDKNMILSDLDVHKEQYPEATFFDRYNVESLKNVLKNYVDENIISQKKLLSERTKEFADNYVVIVKEVIQTSPNR